MKFVFTTLLFLVVSIQVAEANPPAPGLQEDSTVNAIYNTLDLYLENPSFEHLDLFDAIDPTLTITNKEQALAAVILYCNKGFYHMKFSQIATAIEAYEKAWAYYQKFQVKTGYDIIAYCLQPLGNAYSMVGDYASAENIIKSYLIEAAAKGNKEQQAAAFINLSIVYYNTGKYEEAVDVLNQSLALDVKSKQHLIYTNLSKNYIRLNRLDEARAILQQGMALLTKARETDISLLADAQSTLAQIHLLAKDTIAALAQLEKTGAVVSGSEALSPRRLAKLSVQLATLYGATGKPEKALSTYQAGLSYLIPEYKAPAGLPDRSQLYAENTIKEIFDGMAGLYVQQGLLKKAISCYKKSFEVEELLTSTYNYKESKYLQQSENRARAEKVIDLYYTRYVIEGKPNYLKEAFLVAEQTKSLALKDEMHSRQVWAQVEDSLYMVKRRLSKQKSLIETALILEQQKGQKASMRMIERLIEQKNKVSLDLKTVHQQAGLQVNIDRHTSPDIDTLCMKLKRDSTTLVEYFFGEQALYTFVLTGDSIMLQRNDNIAATRKIAFRYSQMFTAPVKINAAPQVFSELSHQLYNMLFETLPETPLLIIPDGLLNFIPFEPLLTAMPSSKNYAKWPWLLNKQTIRYRHAALPYDRKSPHTDFDSDHVLGYFPNFKNTKRFLKYSQVEAEEMQKYLSGDFLMDSLATKRSFMQKANRYPIIHLSTHAKAGGLLEPPSIYFIDSALYLPEIYGLELDTELLVLGACETGIGKLYKGEGPLSVANGFLHAGVNNIVLSLWKVNDFSTSRLMAYFYKHYEDNRQPAQAVRAAKRDYLNDSSIPMDKKSPYYWAAFVYYGDSSMSSGKGGIIPYVYYVLISMALVFFGVVAYKLRKRNR